MNTAQGALAVFVIAALPFHVSLAAEDHAGHQHPASGHVHQSPQSAPTEPESSSAAQNTHDMSSMPGMHGMGEHDMDSMPEMENMPGMREPKSTPEDEQASTQSEREHVPPDPPTHPLGDMSEKRMIDLMQMEDDAPFSLLLIDQLEWRGAHNDDQLAWDLQGFYGDDYNKLWLKSEGERTDASTTASHELLWDRLISRWWSSQLGVRYDTGPGPSRTWAAMGIQGIAPYWFDVEATLYVGEQGRSAVRFTAEYEMLFTQRLVLQPKLEINAYGKSNPENQIGSGVSDTELGLRLRYEFKREFAPYVGAVWVRRYGETGTLARAAGERQSEVQWLAGLRVWF